MKYTFEIMKEYEDAFKGISVYSVSEDKKLMVDFVALEELEDAQKEIDEAYQRGLDDAWEAARRISILESDGGYSWQEMKSIFGTDSANEIYIRHTAVEAIDKIKAYEEKQAKDDIKVGDVVTNKCYNQHNFVVTKVSDESVWGVDANGSWNYWAIDDVTKTDKHFDIGNILEEMRE